MALQKVAWSSPSPASWDCRCATSASVKNRATCCRSAAKISSTHSLPDSPAMANDTKSDQQSSDEKFMREALELAQQGCALASPNPCVGAIVADAAGNIVGRGSHTYEGLKHAEVIALEQAGNKARGATLYLNLEPCCHQGRTGPCTEAVIAAGIKRVVTAMSDPNPLVAGKGLQQLRAAGIDVTENVLESDARRLNEAFAKWIRTHLPLVTLKAAITLDGKIAPPPG